MAQTSPRLKRLQRQKRANSNALRKSNRALKATLQAGTQHLAVLFAVIEATGGITVHKDLWEQITRSLGSLRYEIKQLSKEEFRVQFPVAEVPESAASEPAFNIERVPDAE